MRRSEGASPAIPRRNLAVVSARSCRSRTKRRLRRERQMAKWIRPDFIEISVNCEISAYTGTRENDPV